MARPSRCRRVCTEPAYDGFMPIGIPCGEIMILTVDEYEVIRLIDLERLTHEQCGQQMDISITTVTEIYESARAKIADSIVYGKPLRIAGVITGFATAAFPVAKKIAQKQAAQPWSNLCNRKEPIK